MHSKLKVLLTILSLDDGSHLNSYYLLHKFALIVCIVTSLKGCRLVM